VRSGVINVFKADAVTAIHDQLRRIEKLPGPLILSPVR
jgi:hypothetical protein